MAYVDLPCDTLEWAEQKNVFIMLSHLRSVDDLKLFMDSYTRPDAPPSATSQCLSSLRGLVAFLIESCGPEEQNKFMKKTLPFIAKSAALLEDRIPLSGMPLLEKQENSSLVLGRKVVLSLLSNAFLATFPDSFNFKSFFDVFLEDNSRRRSVQAAKLRAILCYFESASEGRCNLSGVITYRRKVLQLNDLPTLDAWCGNPLPLCPLTVDDELRIENSGGQTLQVCFSSRLPGGDVLRAGSSMEEVRFCVSPEALLVQLVMEDLEPNEVVIVTGSEKFADCRGSHDDLVFVGELKDESEHDVFGNMLNSFVAMDASPVSSAKSRLQYLPGALLRELNKSYAGFLCEEDRGDISMEKLSLSVKRGSLAFAAEAYPACMPHVSMRSAQVQGEERSTGDSQQSKLMPQLTISSPLLAAAETGDDSVPLSPIPEGCESPSSYQAALVGNILMGGVQQFARFRKSPPSSMHSNNCPNESSANQDKEENKPRGGIDEFAARMARSLVSNGEQLVTGERNGLSASPVPPIVDDSSTSGQDSLAAHLATTIINSSLGERMRHQAWVREQEENKKNTDKENGGNLEETSDTLARSIITDALLFREDKKTTMSPAKTSSKSGDDDGQQNGLQEDMTAALVSRLTGSIVSEALRASTSQADSKPISTTYPPIVTQEDRRGSIDSFRSSRSSSLTGQSITVLDFTDEVAREVVREGLSMAQFMLQGMQGQCHSAEEEGEEEEEEEGEEEEEEEKEKEGGGVCEGLASDLASEAVQKGIEIFTNMANAPHTSKDEIQQPKEIVSSFPTSLQPQVTSSQRTASPILKRSLLTNIAESPRKPKQPLAVKEIENEPPAVPSGQSGGPAATPMSQRLLTPLSSRAGYAWSTASTQDEESRPVSPMDMNKLGLTLSSNTDEFSSLVSEMVITDAIGDATGGSEEPTLSPGNISSEENSSVTSSSKIGIYLSQLGEAEPPCDAGVLDDESEEASSESGEEKSGGGLASFSNLWDRMRQQLLRPITTGNWGCGPHGGADPQLRAMIQWVAASACGRPHMIYCTTGDERVNQLARVAGHLRSRDVTVGGLCQFLTSFKDQASEDKTNMFAALLEL